MRALSIKQPWANMIASGEKSIETRTWATEYRGELLLVSSKTPKIEPAGCAVAVAQLIDCRPMTKRDEGLARCSAYRGAFSWVLADVWAIEPFPVKGSLGIYHVSVTRQQLHPRKYPVDLFSPRQRGGA
jgi:hypothetical protein